MPLAPEFVTSIEEPLELTLPVEEINNLLFVLVISSAPLLLLTVPSIVKPPAPLFSKVKEVPFDVTFPVEVTCRPPVVLAALLIISATPLLLLTFPAIVKPFTPSFSILSVEPVDVTVPLTLRAFLWFKISVSPVLVTVPSIVSPFAPELSIKRLEPLELTLPVEVTFKPPLVLADLLIISAIPLLLLTFPAIVKPFTPSFSILSVEPFEVTVPLILSALLWFKISVSPLLVTVPSTISPPEPVLSIKRLVPLEVTDPPDTT